MSNDEKKIKTTRYKTKQISFLNGSLKVNSPSGGSDLPIVKRNNHYAQILIIKNQINDVIENYFHGKISYVYDSHDNLLNFIGNTGELLDYWEKAIGSIARGNPEIKME